MSLTVYVILSSWIWISRRKVVTLVQALYLRSHKGPISTWKCHMSLAVYDVSYYICLLLYMMSLTIYISCCIWCLLLYISLAVYDVSYYICLLLYMMSLTIYVSCCIWCLLLYMYCWCIWCLLLYISLAVYDVSYCIYLLLYMISLTVCHVTYLFYCYRLAVI